MLEPPDYFRSVLIHPILINTIGHSAGILLFGLIILLLSRDSRHFGLRQTALSLLAAYLALVWNAGSLAALSLAFRSPDASNILIAASFAVLSTLPAVLFHVALRSSQGQKAGRSSLIVAGYAVSAMAVVLQCLELLNSSNAMHRAAILTVVLGFAVLVLAALARLFISRQPQPGKKPMLTRQLATHQWLPLTALLLFTSSFLHFGFDHVLDSPWTAEIAWHHLGIPVAVLVLLQDYRLLLLDTFLRFVINSALAALYITALLFCLQRLQLLHTERFDPFWAGLTLVAFCLSTILFTHLKGLTQTWVSRSLFQRRSPDEALRKISEAALSAMSEEHLLTLAAAEVAAFYRAVDFAVVSEHDGDGTGHTAQVTNIPEASEIRERSFRPATRITLRFARGDARILMLAARQGGRRYLSEDLRTLSRLAAALVQEVERFRSEELKRLASQAELRALQAQINPHFFFNALNTLYGTIDRQSADARRLVLNLAEVFRYLLANGSSSIELSEELRIIEAYLEIEALRLGSRLRTELQVDDDVRGVPIPTLSIQPLVENAIKHGIMGTNGGGCVRLKASRVAQGLLVSVEDTGPGFSRTNNRSSGPGMGLENVRRRLILSYGREADLQIVSTGAGTSVSFLVPAGADRDTQSVEASADPLTVQAV